MGWCLKWAVGSKGRGFYDDMKREAEAVPITPFHVNKQVDTVL